MRLRPRRGEGRGCRSPRRRLAVAEKVANAAKEGGFLGFGGERVSAGEKALIDNIKSALTVA